MSWNKKIIFLSINKKVALASWKWQSSFCFLDDNQVELAERSNFLQSIRFRHKNSEMPVPLRQRQAHCPFSCVCSKAMWGSLLGSQLALTTSEKIYFGLINIIFKNSRWNAFWVDILGFNFLKFQISTKII